MRKERVLRALEILSEQSMRGSAGIPYGITAQELAAHLSLLRNNCSADLNELHREGWTIRIAGRPTRYLSKQWVENKLVQQRVIFASEYPSHEAFARAADAGLESSEKRESDGKLAQVIGSQRSLRTAIDQAKMAIGYPPHGMHVLLLGETGVGKSTFARTAFDYAIESGSLVEGAPFGTFNCAEYANNPEILLDHLFGHVKGAFTGAHRDKPGLVEATDGGILFLDEVHRLPPEGQEMLFHLMDYGEFRRLGESAEFHHTRLRLFAATTESPESALLSTFLRRIPMVIRLPALREWSFHDRFELIFRLLSEEAKVTKHTFRLKAEALDRLLKADFPANIGGLKNVLKLACASAFSVGKNVRQEVVIEKHHVQTGSDIQLASHQSLLYNISDMVVLPTSQSVPVVYGMEAEEFNGHIQSLSMILRDLGFSSAEIVDALGREIRKRIEALLLHPQSSEWRHYIGDVFFSWVTQAWTVVEQALPRVTTQRTFHLVALHLYHVLHAPIPDPPSRQDSWQEYVQLESSDLCELSARFIQSFERISGLHLPVEEVYLLPLLLREESTIALDRVGLVVMLLGEGIASNMVAAAILLAGPGLIAAVDVSLHATQEWIDHRCAEAVLRMDRGHGVLVLTDIAALSGLAERANAAVLLPSIRFVFRPDLTMVSRTLYTVQADAGSLDEVAAFVQSSPIRWAIPGKQQAQKVIWACCLTGRGTAYSISRLIEQALPEAMRPNVRVEAIELGGGRSVPEGLDIMPVAIVGSVRPPVYGVPFFAVEEILSEPGIRRLLHMILFDDSSGSARTMDEWVQPSVEPSKQVRDQSEALKRHVQTTLERDLVYVNPVLVMTAVRAMVKYIMTQTARDFSPAWEAKFCLHMAYAIERVIRGEAIVYPYLERVKRLFPHEWGILSELRNITRHYFAVETEENELAYLFEMVFPERAMEMFEL